MASARQDPVVEWYRPRLLGRLLLAWLGASSLLGAGSIGVALALDGSGRVPESWRIPSLIVGVAGTVLGAVGGIFGIVRLISQDDRYLLVRRSGIEVADGGPAPTVVPWARLTAATVDQRCIVLGREGEEPLRIGATYQGISRQRLAERLLELRRQALLGTLRSP